jgi:threonine/homoserine/homoserine lactone efflux protein
MIGLVIFTQLALAGCAFLIYFMFALWRDSRSSRKEMRGEIRKIPMRSKKRKILHLQSIEELCPIQKEKL